MSSSLAKHRRIDLVVTSNAAHLAESSLQKTTAARTFGDPFPVAPSAVSIT